MNSRLYEGTVWHRRRRPREHAFAYRTFSLYLDLAELPALFDPFVGWSARRPALAWFRRSDYHGEPGKPLDKCVRDTVATHTGVRPTGPVRLLTHLRYFGHCFNPVSFYYCFDDPGDRLEFVLAEITNTPWGERHAYVLDLRGVADGSEQHFEKVFHVSPFMPMTQRYAWSFPAPGHELKVRMRNIEEENDVFSAGLQLTARAICARSLTGVLARFPAHTLKVSGAIYWQALRLWLGRVPFHPHPIHGGGPEGEGEAGEVKEVRS